MGKCYQSNWRMKTFPWHGETRPWDSTRDVSLSTLFYRFHTNFQRSLLVLSLLSLTGFFSIKEITKASNCLASRHTDTTSSEQNDNYRCGAARCGSVCYGIFCVSHVTGSRTDFFLPVVDQIPGVASCGTTCSLPVKRYPINDPNHGCPQLFGLLQLHTGWRGGIGRADTYSHEKMNFLVLSQPRSAAPLARPSCQRRA